MNNLLKQIISRGKKETVILKDGERKGMSDMAMSIGEYVKRVFRGKNGKE